MITRFLQTLLLMLSVTSLVNAKVVIWDLGGVLFKTNDFGFARSIGIMNCISYGLRDRQGFSPKPILMETMNTLGVQNEAPGMSYICDSEGVPLPQIMCDWLKGTFTPEQLLNKFNTHIDHLDASSFFVSQREKKLVRQAGYAIFDPYTFARNMHPIRSGVKLLRECADYCDEQGQPHTLIVLSNWDPASFTFLLEQYKSLFSSFDHIIISGDIGLIKPHHACFDFVRNFLQQRGLNPDDCYLIDDQRVNIIAAEQCGFKGIWMQDHRMLRAQLMQAGIL